MPEHGQSSRIKNCYGTLVYVNYTYGQRFEGKINFSIWRHSLEQIYFSNNHNKSNSVYALLVSVAERGRVRKGTFCLHPNPRTIKYLRYLSKNIILA